MKPSRQSHRVGQTYDELQRLSKDPGHGAAPPAVLTTDISNYYAVSVLIREQDGTFKPSIESPSAISGWQAFLNVPNAAGIGPLLNYVNRSEQKNEDCQAE